MDSPARRGRFITFEGIDGAGKSTHLEWMAGALRARGLEVVVSREPGGTPLAERLRDLLLGVPMSIDTETLLMFAARQAHLDESIRPALARGAWVVCDRFTDSTFAYQGGGRGFDTAVLGQLEIWVQQGRQPDLTLWFDLAPATAAARRGAVRAPDRFEAQDEAFFERVRAGYASRCAAAPGRFVRLDAESAREAVWQQVQAAIEARTWW